MSWYSRRNSYDYGYGGWAPYVPVGQKLAKARKHAEKVAKKEGRELAPVKITGKAMANTYWGKASCDNLEAYSDFANRLPRGRTYARNGSVVDLQILKGQIKAIVAGSLPYTITISIETLAKKSWTRLKAECSQSIASLLDLLQGRFDEGVMQRLAHPKEGLFPQPREIKMRCSCPDSAGLCKHLAAVLYAVGNRLDAAPEMLFCLRNVDHLELVTQAVSEGNLDRTLESGTDNALAGSDLGEVFGIDLVEGESAPKRTRRKKPAGGEPDAIDMAAQKMARQTIARLKASPAKASSARAGKPGKVALAKSAGPRKAR
jgi:uncharacterized Zn finger protein